MFQHYAEHKAERATIGIIEFLELHYMHGSPVDDDYARDMQLPFKTSADCVNVITIPYIPASIPTPPERPECRVVKLSFYNSEHFLYSSGISNIWQPPKSACYS